MNENDNRDLISVKKQECLGCVHLIGDLSTEAPETRKSCRQEQGCPAEHMRLVIGTNMEAQATALAAAWRANDPKSLAVAMQALDKVHPRIQDEVFQRAKGKLVLSA